MSKERKLTPEEEQHEKDFDLACDISEVYGVSFRFAVNYVLGVRATASEWGEEISEEQMYKALDDWLGNE